MKAKKLVSVFGLLCALAVPALAENETNSASKAECQRHQIRMETSNKVVKTSLWDLTVAAFKELVQADSLSEETCGGEEAPQS